LTARVGTALRPALALLAFALAGAAYAEDDARVWLKRMSDALATRSYEGEFMHLASGGSERIRILHRVSGNKVSERLVSLTGNRREIIRDDSGVYCYLPDQRKVLFRAREERSSLLASPPRFDADLSANYELRLIGRFRSLVGPYAQVVLVRPRDTFRYGYRLWIDERSHLPVRTDLCDADGHVLEQVVYMSLTPDKSLGPEVMKPGVATEGFVWQRQTASATGGPPAWRVGHVPAGFQLRSAVQEQLPGEGHLVTHLVLSDGLAAVSVFIETADGHRPGTGQGKVGSAFAYSTVLNGHLVTAVGTVPVATVAAIADGIEAGEAAP
jgi:sigma-E factor negative regulatory protein RseB